MVCLEIEAGNLCSSRPAWSMLRELASKRGGGEGGKGGEGKEGEGRRGEEKREEGKTGFEICTISGCYVKQND